MTDLPPVEQPFIADGSEYLAFLDEATAAAEKFAAANAAAVKAVRSLQDSLDGLAAGAAAAAAAERQAADAESAVAEASARAAAGAREAAGAQRDLAASGAGASAAENAAAEASAKAARATAGLGSAAAMADRLQAALNARLRAGLAAELTAARGADQVKDAYEALALAERIAAEEAGNLAVAAAKVSVADFQAALSADAAAEGAAKATETFLLLGQAESFAAGETAKLTATAAALHGVLGANTAAAAAFTASMVAAGASQKALTAATTATTSKLAGMLTLGKLFTGGLWTFASWHYIIDGAIEFGIVIAGAALALGVFAAAGTKAADAVVTHFQAITTVSAATGKAIAPLTTQIQNLQRSMAPAVLQLYGDALGVVNAKTGAFTQLAHQAGSVLDYWGARAALALEHSSTASQVAAHSATYLNMVMQLLANTFGVLGHLMRAAMDTHIAEILFAIAGGAMKLLGVLTSIPTPLLALVLGLHGFYLWGNLARAAFGTLATRAAGLGVSLIGLAVKFGFVGDAGIAMAGKLGATMQQMTAMSAAAKEETGLLTGLANVGKALLAPALLVAAGAAVYFAVKAATAKTATQQWQASLQQAVDKSSMLNGLNNTFAALAKTTTQTDQAQRQFTSSMSAMQRISKITGVSFNQMSATTWQQVVRYGQLRDAQVKWVDEASIAVQRVGALGTKYGGLSQAIGLASLAGVKWSTILHGSAADWKTAQQQIAALVLGYKMMGQSGSAIANDVNAVTFSIEMQDSKVAQLNQAWASFLGTVTGGETSFVAYAQGMATLHTQAGAAGASLNGLNTNSLTLRATFSQSIGAASTYLQSITSMAAASANGARSQQLLARANRDVVAQLLPLAKGSSQARAQVFALAQEAGYHGVNSFKALSQWVGPGGVGKHMRDLNKVTASLTGQVSSLTTDVTKLGTALGVSMNSTFSAAIAKSSGMDQALQKYARDLTNAHTPASVLYKDQLAIADAEARATRGIDRGTAGLNRAAREAAGAARSAQAAAGQTDHLGASANAAGTKLDGMGVKVSRVIAHVSRLGQAGQDGGTSLAKGVDSSSPKAVSAAGNMVKAMHAKLAALNGQAKAAGANASAGLAAGISAGQGAVVAAAAAVADAATAAFRSHLHVHSPSTLTHQYGLWTIQGLINGLIAGGPKLMAAIRNITNSIMRAFHDGAVGAGRESSLVSWVKADNAKLQALGAQRKAIAAQIAAGTATDKALQSSFSSIIGLGHAPAPYTGKVPTAQQMVANLRTELGDIKRFASDLRKLKALGLDNSIIQRIIAMGPMQGTAYAEALITAAQQSGTAKRGPHGGPPTVGGGGIIAQLNSAYAQIQAYSKSAAVSVTNAMYDAGKAAGKGLLAGLKSQMKAIDAQMRHIADILVHAIRKALKIHSPSAVMHDHGLMITKGLADGINAGGPMVEAAMKHIAGIIASSKLYVPPLIGLHPAHGGSVNPGGPMGGTPVISPGGALVPWVNPGGPRGGPPLLLPRPAGVNPGGTIVNVHLEIHGHVKTEHDLHDSIRDHVQRYLHTNGNSGLTPRPGRG